MSGGSYRRRLGSPCCCGPAFNVMCDVNCSSACNDFPLFVDSLTPLLDSSADVSPVGSAVGAVPTYAHTRRVRSDTQGADPRSGIVIIMAVSYPTSSHSNPSVLTSASGTSSCQKRIIPALFLIRQTHQTLTNQNATLCGLDVHLGNL